MSTPLTPSTALREAFQAVAQVVYAGSSYEDVYTAICDSAVDLVDGCHHASLMLRRGNRIYTAGATDTVARDIDTLERALGTGPCLDAILDEPAHSCPDLTTGSQWPDLAARVLADTPVRGMAGFRLVVDDKKVGALNIFSDEPGALDGEPLDQTALLASFVSVALSALDRGDEATTLRRGLESNREIGKAVGLLMAVHGVTDEEAFTLLSNVSQTMNLKLAAVASRVIAQHNEGRPRP